MDPITILIVFALADWILGAPVTGAAGGAVKGAVKEARTDFTKRRTAIRTKRRKELMKTRSGRTRLLFGDSARSAVRGVATGTKQGAKDGWKGAGRRRRKAKAAVGAAAKRAGSRLKGKEWDTSDMPDDDETPTATRVHRTHPVRSGPYCQAYANRAHLSTRGELCTFTQTKVTCASCLETYNDLESWLAAAAEQVDDQVEAIEQLERDEATIAARTGRCCWPIRYDGWDGSRTLCGREIQDGYIFCRPHLDEIEESGQSPHDFLWHLQDVEEEDLDPALDSPEKAADLAEIERTFDTQTSPAPSGGENTTPKENNQVPPTPTNTATGEADNAVTVLAAWDALATAAQQVDAQVEADDAAGFAITGDVAAAEAADVIIAQAKAKHREFDAMVEAAEGKQHAQAGRYQD